MRRTATDSKRSSLASQLGEGLQIWFEENRQYPESLERIWQGERMRRYSDKYGLDSAQRAGFRYTARGNSYELVFTGFGNIYTEMGTNGNIATRTQKPQK